MKVSPMCATNLKRNKADSCSDISYVQKIGMTGKFMKIWCKILGKDTPSHEAVEK